MLKTSDLTHYPPAKIYYFVEGVAYHLEARRWVDKVAVRIHTIPDCAAKR